MKIKTEEMKGKVFSQKTMQTMLLPILRSEGVLYKKKKSVLARPAIKGEKILTVTSDGLETSNNAREGDFIIQNQTGAKEEYIISGSKFEDRYEFLRRDSGEYSLYKPTGKVIALQMSSEMLSTLDLQHTFYFIAPWKEEMVVKKDDYLVCPPDHSEVYRIARKEFFETYQAEE